MQRATLFLIILILFKTAIPAPPQFAELSDAVVVHFNDQKLTLKALQVLQEEAARRTALNFSVTRTLPTDKAVIVLALDAEAPLLPLAWQTKLCALEATKPEGFKIVTVESPRPGVLILAHDQRGLLYGVGYLLRKAEMRYKQFDIPKDLAVSTSPRYPLRGHQLGYRPKTNAYDAWNVQQFDQYIRELALFGANSIEIMPPRTDDDQTSVHMKMPAIKMMAEQSRICQDYGLDVWMWYPNMGLNYMHPDSIKKELQERHQVFSATPKLDHLFVPGGDPGELEPDILFAWLEQVATVLHAYHSQAKIWVSPQVFRPTQKWFDAFFQHVNKGHKWFGGVVFGPWVKIPIEEIRRILDPQIPIRRYPDITHSLSCQYPIPRWDLAYAITLGRECINPRPKQEKAIHNAFDQYAIGSLSYSEGTNDDVNKFVWTGQDWDPELQAIETLRDYARFFIGPDWVDQVAQGLLALEKNIEGPLLTNDGVQRTWWQWQTLEKRVPEKVRQNFRFQMGLIRACFDAYQQRRLFYESELEHQARDALRNAAHLGADSAVQQARSILEKASTDRVRPDLRQRCFALADSLWASIGAQLTVAKHHAMPGRGNFIDNIDMPLNDAVWMRSMFDYIDTLPEEQQKLAAIGAMLNRTNPGPGGIYVNPGSPKSWQFVRSEKTWQSDPGSLASPRISFGVGLKGEEWVHEITAKGFEGGAAPQAWMHQITTLYDQPLMMTFAELDPTASYRLRIAYTGRFRSKMKLIADGHFMVHGALRTGEKPIYEFSIPAAVTADGALELKWSCDEGERGSQVSELWLLPEK